jgi:hypothetical protein
MRKQIKAIIITFCFLVGSYFLIDLIRPSEYKYYYKIRERPEVWEEISMIEFKENYPSEFLKKEKQLNYNALFISIAIGVFTIVYKKPQTIVQE